MEESFCKKIFIIVAKTLRDNTDNVAQQYWKS